jgi:hypothetical protein
MKYGYREPSNDKLVVIASCIRTQPASPAIGEAEYRRMKEKTRVNEIKARAASVPLHQTLR